MSFEGCAFVAWITSTARLCLTSCMGMTTWTWISWGQAFDLKGLPFWLESKYGCKQFDWQSRCLLAQQVLM
jgi:hypothetical protein